MSNEQFAIPVAEVASFCECWKVKELAASGSILRTGFGPDSDIDLLVSCGPAARWSLFDLVTQEGLQAVQGRVVDLVECEAMELGGSGRAKQPCYRRTIPLSRRVLSGVSGSQMVIRSKMGRKGRQ